MESLNSKKQKSNSPSECISSRQDSAFCFLFPHSPRGVCPYGPAAPRLTPSHRGISDCAPQNRAYISERQEAAFRLRFSAFYLLCAMPCAQFSVFRIPTSAFNSFPFPSSALFAPDISTSHAMLESPTPQFRFRFLFAFRIPTSAFQQFRLPNSDLCSLSCAVT